MIPTLKLLIEEKRQRDEEKELLNFGLNEEEDDQDLIDYEVEKSHKAKRKRPEKNQKKDESFLATRTKRFTALLIDGLLFLPVVIFLSIIMGTPRTEKEFLEIMLIQNSIIGILGLAYFLMLVFKGQSLGMINQKIKIVDEKEGHQNPNFIKHLGRYIIFYGFGGLGWVTSFIPDNRKRCLHDMIVKTIVVNTD